MRRLRHGPLTFGVREGRPHRSPDTTRRRPVAQRKCAISAESCSGGPPLSPRPSLSRPLFRYFGTICRQLLLSFLFDGHTNARSPQETHASKRLTLPPGQGVRFLNTTHSLRLNETGGSTPTTEGAGPDEHYRGEPACVPPHKEGHQRELDREEPDREELDRGGPRSSEKLPEAAQKLSEAP